MTKLDYIPVIEIIIKQESNVMDQACARCGLVKPRESFRVKATPAQKQRWNKDWITSGVCDTCRKPANKKPTLGPVGLFKKLTNAGLPAPIIEMRVEKQKHINKTRRVAGLRKAWREKNAEQTQHTLASLDREATQNRNRITYALRVGMASPLIKALDAYNQVLIATRATIKENANAGKAPPTPWHDAIPKEQKLELITTFKEALEQLKQSNDTWAQNYAHRVAPSWWSEFVMQQTKGE